MTGAACIFSTVAIAQTVDEPSLYRHDVIAKIDTLTILQLSDPLETPPARVNLLNIFCPYNDMARQYLPEGGVATLEQGTIGELTDALDEYTFKMKAFGLGNEAVRGFAMAIIDKKGTIHPSYTFNQASKQAESYRTDADLGGVSPQDRGLIRQINQLYVNYCFGNS